MNNKILLIISGECFRDGGQNSRQKDTTESLKYQFLATSSHIKFIEYIQNKYNINVDIQILSYHSKYENELIKQYEKYNLTYKFYNKYFSDRTQLTNSYKIDNIEQKYMGILVIRPDMYLKDYFMEIFNPFVDKIYYISVCFLKHHLCIGNVPRINDTSIYIPFQYFSQIYYDIGIKLYHESILDYISHGLSLQNFDFWLHTLHDSDSAKDYNPASYLVSRPYNKIWHSYGYEINNLNFLPKLVYKKFNYSDWSIFNNINDHDMMQIDVDHNNVWEWWHQEPNELLRFINLINIDTNINNKFITTTPTRHQDETFWNLFDNQKLIFYNTNKIPTSILYRNDNYFIGGSIDHNYKFILRKLIL